MHEAPPLAWPFPTGLHWEVHDQEHELSVRTTAQVDDVPVSMECLSR